jgi:hypothetical protein
MVRRKLSVAHATPARALLHTLLLTACPWLVLLLLLLLCVLCAGIFNGASFVFFSFIGFDCVSTLAEEVRGLAYCSTK